MDATADPALDDDLDALADRIGSAVRELRLAQRWSLGDLARASGLSKTILARIERGDGNPSVETLWRVSRALGVPLGAVLTGDPGPPRPPPSRACRATAVRRLGHARLADPCRGPRAALGGLRARPAGRRRAAQRRAPARHRGARRVPARAAAGRARRRRGGARCRRRRLVRCRRRAPLPRSRGQRRAGLDALRAAGRGAVSVAAPRRAGLAQPVLAGVVASIAGFASTFPLVLAGLRAVGASPAQSSSGLLALCLTLGVGCLALSRRYRMPVTLAWSTPGAALLVSAGAVDGGYPAALGAFAVCGLLLALAGLWRPLARLIG